MQEILQLKKGEVSYTCPMQEHSAVIMDTPGKCPKCDMALVPKMTEKK